MSVLKVKILRTILDGFWVRVFIVAWWKANFALIHKKPRWSTHVWGRLEKHDPIWEKHFLGFIAYSMKTHLKSFNVSRLLKTQAPSGIFLYGLDFAKEVPVTHSPHLIAPPWTILVFNICHWTFPHTVLSHRAH